MSIRKRGNYYQFTIELGKDEHGKRKRISKGGFKSKNECSAAEKQLIYELEHQKYKFCDMSNDYFNNYVSNNCRERTIETYRGYYDNHIAKVFNEQYMDEITTNDIYTFLLDISNTYSREVLKGIKCLLGAIFNYCIYPKQIITINPVSFVNLSKFKCIEYPEKVLTKHNVNDIISYLSAKNSPYLIVIQIMYHTGMRASEVLGLQWNNVDLINNVIHVRQQLSRSKKLVPPKTKAGVRDINIDNRLKDVLISQKRFCDNNANNNNFVCIKRNGDYIIHTNLNCCSKYINRDVCEFKYHALRTLHCTMLIEAGAPLVDVSRRLGHANTRITLDVYTKCTNKMTDKTIELLENIL